MSSVSDQAVPEREGLQAALVLGTWAYFVLLLSHLWTAVPWPVWCNRIGSMLLFLSLYRRFSRGAIEPRQMTAWTLALTVWTVLSIALSYIWGASPHVTARIGFMMLVAAVLGLPRRFHVGLLLFGLAVTVLLQLYFPSPSDPGLNLLPTLVCMVFSIQANRARCQIFDNLAEAHRRLGCQAQILEMNLAEASRQQARLDSDVAHATGDLERTNSDLAQAIEDQIGSFHENQRLSQETSRLLYSQALGRAAGAAAHDFNNLLGVISATLEVHEADLSRQPASRAAFELMSAEVDRAMVVGRRVLGVSGKQILRPEKVCLPHLMGQWLPQWQRQFPKLRLITLEPTSDVCCDLSVLRQVLDSLLRNAAEASPPLSEILLEVGPLKSLSVGDQGPALSDSLQAQLFEPFFTTQRDGHHLGLSLAAARALLRQQGGDVLYQTSPKRFRVLLP